MLDLPNRALASTFFVFVQVCDVRPLVRTHCFSADQVADSFLLAVDLAERTIQVPLPVDLIAVDLIGKYRQTRSAQATVLTILFFVPLLFPCRALFSADREALTSVLPFMPHIL